MADSEASLDEQLELKKRARRRLVGATALVLLAAIVLPMVMDREPRPVNPDIQIRIPSQDGNSGFAAHVAPAKPAATPLPPVTPAAEPAAAAAVDAKPEAKTETPLAKEVSKATVPVTAPNPAPEKAIEKPVTKPADKPVAAKPAMDKPAEKAQAKPVEKVADKKADEARAADALSGGTAEQWVIQLGAYK